MGTGFAAGPREPHTTRLSLSLSGGLRAALAGTCFPREAGSASTCSPGPGEGGGGVEVGRGGRASRQRSSQSEASHRVISTHHHGLVLRSEFRLVFPTAGAGRRPSQALVMVSPYGGQLQGFSVLRSKAALPGTS